MRASSNKSTTGKSSAAKQPSSGEQLLFLTDAQLRQGIELMFFSYRAFTRDPDQILGESGLGRAHHRALHFIGGCPGLTVAELIEILGVTKQSLNRVLRELLNKGLVEQRQGVEDKRLRHLYLTDKGTEFERELAEAQRARVRRAFMEAGSDAVAGFRKVLEKMVDPEMRDELNAFIARPAGKSWRDRG